MAKQESISEKRHYSQRYGRISSPPIDPVSFSERYLQVHRESKSASHVVCRSVKLFRSNIESRVFRGVED